jgi:hypothetical protein
VLEHVLHMNRAWIQSQQQKPKKKAKKALSEAKGNG